SSITDQDEDIIQEIIIDDEEINKPIKPIFVLSLVFLLTLLLGLLFIVRKKKKQVSNDHFSSLSNVMQQGEPEIDEPNFDASVIKDNAGRQTDIDGAESTEANDLNSDINKDDNPR
ncbi:hypothetical protein N9472_03385, partial [Methylophilaceae bacterium]|nr:hypothetical protein [Methylophilaceae bacterium]